MTDKFESDEEVLAAINEQAALVKELEAGDDPDRVTKVEEAQVELDRLWDLRRRREAQERNGEEPPVEERPAEVVESYLQ